LGGGDSGGPSFVWNATTAKYELAAINTFSFEGDGYNTAPFFGSGLGGILVHPYLDWIAGVLSGSGGGGGGGGNNGGKGGGKPNSSQEIVDWAIPPLQASPSFSSGAASEALHSESSDGQLDADVAIVEPAAVRVVSDRPSVVITSTDRHDERNEGAEEADTLAALDFIFANSLFT
jgi:hypothetical protein